MSQPPLYLFDAYGTLFDLSAAARRVLGDRPEQAALLAEIWRSRQLEYAWTDVRLGVATDFWAATCRALDTALEITANDRDGVLRGRLLEAYAELDAYPDALPALRRINDAGGRCIVFSNANDDMLRRSVSAAGLGSALADVVSVDAVGRYKPDSRAYAYICDYLAIEPRAGHFVSSNAWDAAGAARAGLRSVWVNRQSITYPYPHQPVLAAVASLDALPLDPT